jgi:hypothetical protein
LGVEVVAEFRVQGLKSSEGDGRTAADIEALLLEEGAAMEAQKERAEQPAKEDGTTWD